MVKLCNTPYENDSKYQCHFELFAYTLSDFQKYAIEAIVEGHHVLTAAPTGSGKTLSAEFAIQHFVAQGKRVFYTTPIKALSNQKYYEFTQKYPHISVGLLTGDIKTNPDADVVIMTAEILTNMLFVNSVDAFPAAAVVMDEVHYINDEHRGQTWEQTILMLPRHVQLIMLSATLDTPETFAEWVETSKWNAENPKQVYLASTNHRIVPLSHYAYIATTESFLKTVKDKALEQQIRTSSNKLVKIQTDRNLFLESGVKEVARVLTIFENRELVLKRKFVLNNLATFLKENDMLPAICFVFSRKNVEKCAAEMTANLLEDDSKVPYIVRRECEQVIRRLSNYQEYLALPEYNTLVALLEKGIGIHHSGMIPILREIVELMISKKYIKLLFATESFSIGLDCPIRTAIFTSLRKFDGNHDRYLLPHEYTQSAGRAGRRGIDTIGHVVHCSNLFPMPSLTEYKEIMCGKPQKLVSKFRIHYSMVLRLIQHGQTADFHLFAEKSMIQHELHHKQTGQTHLVDQLASTLLRKKTAIEFLRTPIDACRAYIGFSAQLKTAVNRKRKDCERELRVLKETYRAIEEDAKQVLELDRIQSELETERTHANNLESYLVSQTGHICDILKTHGFVFYNEEAGYAFTPLGQVAANIAEVHPLVLATCIMEWAQFSRFSTVQLIAFLSCFADVKVPEDQRKIEPVFTDSFLEYRVRELKQHYLRFEEMELASELYTGIDYETAVVYDLVDEMAEWCACETEEQCKYFLQNRITAERGISVGDFTKACMKISAISKEIANVCEQMGFVECMFKLSTVDTHILKYIATTQSLYV